MISSAPWPCGRCAPSCPTRTRHAWEVDGAGQQDKVVQHRQRHVSTPHICRAMKPTAIGGPDYSRPRQASWLERLSPCLQPVIAFLPGERESSVAAIPFAANRIPRAPSTWSNALCIARFRKSFASRAVFNLAFVWSNFRAVMRP